MNRSVLWNGMCWIHLVAGMPTSPYLCGGTVVGMTAAANITYAVFKYEY